MRPERDSPSPCCFVETPHRFLPSFLLVASSSSAGGPGILLLAESGDLYKRGGYPLVLKEANPLRRRSGGNGGRMKASTSKRNLLQRRMEVDGLDPETCTPDEAMAAVETIIGYQFSDRTLLETALTHSSFPAGTSYERLEFVGDAVLGHLFSTHLYISYPNLDQGALSLLRAANVSTEKLARAAVKLGLYRFLRRNSPSLDDKVLEFSKAIQHESAIASVKPPKIVRHVLAPMVTPETLQSHPWTELLELCQKVGKELKLAMKVDKMGLNVIHVLIDGVRCGTGRNENKDLAKIAAARLALEKFRENQGADPIVEVIIDHPLCDGVDEDGAKHMLNVLCGKMHWPFPIYKLIEEDGPAHDKKFISSVEVTKSNEKLIIKGDLKGRVKDSENSAAQKMLNHLSRSGRLTIQS
ncbi:ribonuclease 3-like protein 2 isoform X2 [Nymphaea colorata]|uniref:ribonuclease 3-like protein 2 isoform X2 n=1 Tax=Nymphaea colorata TaxID=210225 RepID=UPI00129D3714|nr:ribonuclease 3-like protein 2 isoform X2 [Nymphaea colorata]